MTAFRVPPDAPLESPALGRILGVLCIGIAATSTGAVLGRLALDAGASAMAAAAYRVAFATALVMPLAVRHRRPVPGLATLWRAGPLAGIALAFHFGLWIASLAWTSVASSVALVTSHPLMVAAASPVLIGERPSKGVLAGVSLAVAGVLVIAVGDGLAQPRHLRGDVLALGGAAAFALYIMVGRRARAVVPLVEYVAVVYAVAALALMAAGIAGGQPMTGFAPGVWGLFLVAAIVPQLVGHSSFNWALSHVSATYVSGITLAEILGSGALAWVLLGERPPGRTIAGAILIGAGLFAATRSERRRLTTTAATQGP